MQEEPKDFKVVEGDGSELEISPVYDHINSLQQARKQNKETIIIPTANNKATKVSSTNQKDKEQDEKQQEKEELEEQKNEDNKKQEKNDEENSNEKVEKARDDKENSQNENNQEEDEDDGIQSSLFDDILNS